MIINSHRFRYGIWYRLFLGVTILAMLMGSQAVPASVVQAAANTLTLNVISARTEPRAFSGAGVNAGDSIPDFKYIINIDDTGTTEQRAPDPGSGCLATDPGYPANCNWPSIKEPSGWSPIYAQGNQDDFPMDLPDGRYLISVLADGYKIDGAHFSVTNGGISSSPLLVELQPNPLPDGTLRALVFEDNAPTNMGWDVGEAYMAGFVGHIVDTLGEIQTDVYGNPLCTRYEGENPDTYEIPLSSLDADMLPIPIPGSGGNCVSDANGMLAIPHLGSNRYAVSVTPPDGTGPWIQTTTLEGNHDYDVWLMEGDTGYSTIFARGGEPTPDPIFGFVQPTDNLAAGSGHITGAVVGIKTYTPPIGGAFDFWGGNTGTKVNGPIVNPWLSLSDLQAGDVAVWVGQGDANGNFDISGVPDGNYTLSWWDEPQDYNLNMNNVTISGGQTVNLGQLPLNGWWTEYDGYVFNDTNRNGVRDSGEPGVPGFTLTIRHRENNLYDRGQSTAVTDSEGHYYFESGYPIGEWTILEAYSDSYYTTGVTYQADNQPEPTTVKGFGVDVSVLPIIGLSGRMDWGVHSYAPNGGTPGIDPDNGGIVGTVSYGTTRNELDPQYFAAEDWQPGVSGVLVELYAPVACGTTTAPCDADGRYELAPDGSFAQGQLLNTYISESWERPTGCTARDVDGNPLVHGVDENVLVPSQETTGECISSFMQGIQFATYPTDQGTPDANFGAAVNGNYGFGDGCFNGTLDATDPSNPVCVGGDFESLPAADYLVHIAIPDDETGKPMYKVTGEEDINIANGDQIIPQVPPPSCAGPLHTVDIVGFEDDAYPELVGEGGVADTDGDGFINEIPIGVTVPASTPVDNATFIDIGGSPFEGMQRARCDTKLVDLKNGKSIVPIFEVFTDVPVPARLRTVIIDDLRFSTDPRSIMYGEKAGLAFAPVGIYDFANKLEYTTETDFNGIYDVLMPSTNHISCPTPSGVCANMYRFVANDPGIPGRLNPNYNPAFATMAAGAEAIPGVSAFADLAPTQVGLTIEQAATGLSQAVACTLDAATPQLFAVSQPYVNGNGSFTINGLGFGSSGQVTLDGTIVLPTTSWSDTQIAVTVPAGTPAGPHQLNIKGSNGQSTVNGLTFHILGSSFGPFPTTGVLANFNGNNGGNGWNTNGSGFTFINNAGNANDYLRIRGADNSFSTARRTSGPSFGTNQEAFFTFRQPSSASTADEQGLMLKWSGSNTPTNTSAQWIEVALDNSPANTVNVYTKTAGSAAITLQGTITSPSAFVAGNILGARALADGTINVYRNGVQIGTVSVPITGAWTGNIGIRFEGTGSGTPASAETQIDDFGGGNVALAAGSYNPNLYEVGPGRTYAAIQDALDAAFASAGDDLVVAYPNTVDLGNPRLNPRGSYYENLIMASPVKLQGVGPGGFQGATFVPGSIIDASAYGGDTAAATDWFNKIGTLIWDGNQAVNDAQAIYILASQNPTTAAGVARQFTSNFKASIDGFDIRGGIQNGFPGNINDLTGGATGLPPTIETQGGAIFANAYVRFLQITNNVVQNNGGSYGTIRIGTPDVAAPDTNQHNEDVRIANNRVIANGGTNLAGGIGLFAGSDRYEVANNDICGNFSLEYGGGLSVYGSSPNGKIHHNRVYFNFSNDEGGGIMIAGALPATPGTLSPGSGPVDIYNNQIQANLANDDGGGLRFLMAGNFPMNVYNNMIVNNVSTHEGGGIGLNDSPNVRVFNNTIMKNMTTATAVTSNGLPAPAGLSSSANSGQLQATLPGGSPLFSNPLLFNNIFWDNRAGTRAGTTVTGLGLVGDPSPFNQWDLGLADGTGVLAPTNSVVQQNAGLHPYTSSPTNNAANPAVASTYDVSVSFATWRQNPAFVDATLVTVQAPPNLLGNYHLGVCPGSPACNLGAANKAVPAYQQPPTPLNAPTLDFDNQARPNLGGFDSGADEFYLTADLSITKTDGQTSVNQGGSANYTILVSNAGPSSVTGATVTDTFPASLTVGTWTCSATAGSSCTVAGTGNNRTGTVNLLNGGSATFTANTTLAANATGNLVNTASVAAPSDPNTGNNSATDTDTIILPPANLSITKTDNVSSVSAGGTATYIITIGNAGPGNVTGATVADTFPAVITGATWTCTASGGSSCANASGSGNISQAVNILNGGSVTFTVLATISPTASGTVANTATVTTPVGITDPDLTNNTATDTDTIVALVFPTLTVLDNFNRTNAITLNIGAPAGVNWSQPTTNTGFAAVKVDTNQALCTPASGFAGLLINCTLNGAMWNGAGNVFGNVQGAAFTVANATFNGDSLILKATGGNANTPANFIRVALTTTSVVVTTNTNSGGTQTSTTTISNTNSTFANGDTLTARVDASGTVFVWKNATFVGSVALPNVALWTTGGGRIGMQIPSNARVDNFAGGTIP